MMIRYKLTSYGVYDRDNNESIPENEDNARWQNYLKWAEMNEPEPVITDLEMEQAGRESNKLVRDMELNDLTIEFNDRVFQANPASAINMALAILGLPDDNATIQWITADNSVVTITKADLQEIMALIVKAGESIYIAEEG